MIILAFIFIIVLNSTKAALKIDIRIKLYDNLFFCIFVLKGNFWKYIYLLTDESLLINANIWYLFLTTKYPLIILNSHTTCTQISEWF